MAHRSIIETFKAIRPQGGSGRSASPISIGLTSNDSSLGTSLSGAAQQISQLQEAYKQQATLIAANTQALQSNTSAQGTHSVAGTLGSVASGLFGGVGLLSPLISGIASLFGGGSSKPVTSTAYVAPPSVQINAMLNSATPAVASGNSGQTTPPASATNGPAQSGTGAGQNSSPTQVTVNINALDSQSFMDRSTDIANAVREAMLNMHPINEVVSSL